MNITITEKAKNILISKEVGTEKFLRVKIIEGGCAGMTYDAEIDSDLKSGESVVFQDGDVRVVAGTENSHFLDGLHIDYSDDLVSAGLRLTNSRSVSTCGCGSSFNLSGFPVVENGKCGK
ncbi:MAG: iron-sulfur cluster assembly accessory protein [Desulfobulbaceae bacterium]|uniref:Iron-sulfur cluster assembly accessory protein n=1 Tax=Candidatus Desulfobia pelagia TaxID=2841692 RepID=A0A8J6NB07_9BACT|nr:iron-sulfur cluster assembly accessory protein [Candidatus Desulfobia pelagia]